MTKDEILEGNKLIFRSPFHSTEYDSKDRKKNYGCDFYVKYIPYHKDWNLLKPVIDRIFEYSLAYPEQVEKIRKMSIVVGIEFAYPIVLEFIAWYNLNAKK